MAHEIGHNLGMLHDFDALHGGQNNPCNSKNNIMSYGSSMQTWSLCSKKDFQSYYTRIKSKWCMEGKILFLVECIALLPLPKHNYMSIFLCSFSNIQLTLETFVTPLVEEEALIFMTILDYIHFIIYV